MIQRLISPLKSNSFFLFGPRGSGKSTFLKQYFDNDAVLWIDLLNPDQEDRYALTPELLLHEIEAKHSTISWVVIDEVQKNPKLLDVVHSAIERYRMKFALTGSSARKLKRGSANLLAGRAFVYYLYPFTHLELGNDFNIIDVLNWGTLPQIMGYDLVEEKIEYLRAYAHTYLREEIWAEQLIRNIDPFRKFLEVSAQLSGEILNYSSIARDVGVDYKSIQNYYQILEDTLVGCFVEPYHRSIRKQQRQSPKFYWFDTGIKRALDRSLNQPITEHSYGFGRLFEQFLVTEIVRLNHYRRLDYQLSYLRTKDQLEVDLILDRPGMPPALIEIKSSLRSEYKDAHALKKVKSDFPEADAFVLSRDPHERKWEGVWFLPWQKGLSVLGLAS